MMTELSKLQKTKLKKKRKTKKGTKDKQKLKNEYHLKGLISGFRKLQCCKSSEVK